jgi:hypothetical protein
MPGGLDDLTQNLLNTNGQGGATYSSGNQTARNIYPAVVVSIDDPTEQNRIIARIVNLDQNGAIKGGRDRDTPDEKLPFCVPMLPEHFHVRPLVGEMVFIFLENPSDNTAPRYWMGPITSSKLKLKFQDFKESIKIFDYTVFNVNPNIKDKPKVATVFPEQSDVAVQGRGDADLILRQREAYIVAGKFKSNTLDVNTETPSYLQLKQFDNVTDGPLKAYSQANLQSTNVNIFSPLGKFRNKDLAKFEKNEELKSLGEFANSLHPAVFGDELVKVLNLIIIVLLNHIHTPQNPMLSIPESKELQEYTVDGSLQNILSKFIRIN